MDSLLESLYTSTPDTVSDEQPMSAEKKQETVAVAIPHTPARECRTAISQYLCSDCGFVMVGIRNNCEGCGVKLVSAQPRSAHGASLEDYRRRAATSHGRELHPADCHCFDCVPYGTDKVIRDTEAQHKETERLLESSRAIREEAEVVLSNLPAHNANAYVYTAADMEAAIAKASETREGMLSLRLEQWLKSINAWDEDTPISEQCKQAVEREVKAAVEAERKANFHYTEIAIRREVFLAVAAEREAIAAAVADGQRWGRTIHEVEMCREIAAAIRARERAAQAETIDGGGDSGNPSLTFRSDVVTAKPESVTATNHFPLCTFCGNYHAATVSCARAGSEGEGDSRPLSHLRSNTHQVLVNNTLYGYDGEGIYRISLGDKGNERDFAAPVTPYITEHGWKWEEVRVEDASWVQAVNFHHGNETLHYAIETGTWMLSVNGLIQGVVK